MASLHSPSKHEDFLLPQTQELPSFKVTDVRAGLLLLSDSPFPGVLLVEHSKEHYSSH